MTETLSFPGLGLSFDLKREAFTVFGLPVYWYGVIIAFAFLLGAIYTLRRTKEFGVDSDRMMDVILGGVVLGIVGARLYYVIFSWDDFKDDLVQVFNIRHGGLAIYGGIIGAFLAGLLMCKWRKVKLLPCLDCAVGGLLIGQGIGRWGNFTNIEAFGSNTTLPWGMTSPGIEAYLQANRQSLEYLGMTVDPSQPVHPTFLYESIWCLLGFFLIAWYTKRRRYDGELALLYVGWYGLGRFFIEGLRTDPLVIGTVRVSQLLALLCVIASVLILATIRSRIKREADPDYLPLYVNTPEGQAVLAGEFYKKPEKAEKTAASKEEKEVVAEAADSEEPDVLGEGEEDEPAEAEKETSGEESGEAEPAEVPADGNAEVAGEEK